MDKYTITTNWIIQETINKYLIQEYKKEHKAKFNDTINTNQYGQAIKFFFGRCNLRTNKEKNHLFLQVTPHVWDNLGYPH